MVPIKVKKNKQSTNKRRKTVEIIKKLRYKKLLEISQVQQKGFPEFNCYLMIHETFLTHAETKWIKTSQKTKKKKKIERFRSLWECF